MAGLTFLPIFIGGIAACLSYIFYWNPHYAALTRQYAPAPVPAEARLDICIYAAPGFAVAFFWFGWTSFPSISLWAPLSSGLLLGFTIVWAFLGLMNYIIDTYLFVAASALATNTVMRSVFGAAFPLFADKMFTKLTPPWASTLVGCIAMLMLPIPLVLKRFGSTLRQRSKFAPALRQTLIKLPAAGSMDSIDQKKGGRATVGEVITKMPC